MIGILLAVVLPALLIWGMLTPIWWDTRLNPFAFFPTRNATVLLVCDLLRNAPDWKTDHFRAEHPTGVKIWIANSSYGLDLDIARRRIELTARDKVRIFRAYLAGPGAKRKLNAVKQAAHDAQASALAARIVAQYGDKA